MDGEADCENPGDEAPHRQNDLLHRRNSQPPKIEGEKDQQHSCRYLDGTVPDRDLVVDQPLDGQVGRDDLCRDQLSNPFRIRRVRINGSAQGNPPTCMTWARGQPLGAGGTGSQRGTEHHNLILPCCDHSCHQGSLGLRRSRRERPGEDGASSGREPGSHPGPLRDPLGSSSRLCWSPTLTRPEHPSEVGDRRSWAIPRAPRDAPKPLWVRPFWNDPLGEERGVNVHLSNPPPPRSGPRGRGGRTGMRVMLRPRSFISCAARLTRSGQ